MRTTKQKLRYWLRGLIKEQVKELESVSPESFGSRRWLDGYIAALWFVDQKVGRLRK